MAERGRSITQTSVEAAALAVGFMTALRRAGLPTSPDRAARFAEALALVPPDARERLYWTSRVVLVSSSEQLPVFDAVFDAVFGGFLDPADSRGDLNAPPAIGAEPRARPAAPDNRPTDAEESEEAPRPPAALPGRDGADDRAGPEREATLLVASAEERLHEMSFAELSGDEIAQIRHLVRRIVLSTPERQSRRTRRSQQATERLDLRRTVRAAERSGGDSIRLVYSRRRPRARRLVLLCDVSGSMEPYTRVFLSLLQGSVAGAQAEAFVFSTRLTRLTRQLASRDADEALARAAESASDWAGGTRLAESIRRFIDEHGRRGLARGAVVVIISDGWAQDAPEQVGAQMARLSRLAHRIVWVNPRKVAAGYRPLVGGMAAAMPYIDSFVSGHSYAALAEVAAAIRDDRRAPQGKPHHTTSDTT
ncbi:vWA domain-containing protein [Cryobacterium tagatosivorans]|uniref:VWA domain-containing protein n=1 Tax=Cryobacterium tagatosivorans TaxID=1259199 RepID=A0A4R8UEJ4_9MICO|nr:VWA domain-containing protein [Cryobacterium tagatosivorans]TFB49502.1 VWA domain-containing protein [Cryobacterium tagatosivorans]